MTAGRYTPLHSSIWMDPDFTALEPEAQRLYLLIISQPDMTYAGVTSYTPNRWARMSANTTPGQIDAALRSLAAARFVFVDDFTEEVMVRTFVEHNRIWEQRQLHKALQRAYAAILSTDLRRLFWNEQSDDVKALVGSPPAASPKPGGEPARSLPASPPEASGISDLDLDLEPDHEPKGEPEAERVPQWHDLVAPKADHPLFFDEGDTVIAGFLDVFPHDQVLAAIRVLADDGRRFNFASQLRTALASLLGDPPAKAGPSPLDGQAAAARKRAEEDLAHLAAVKDEVARTVPETREEREARIAARRAERQAS